MKKDVCPKCSEYRRVAVTISTPTERFPKPIWKFLCRCCGHSWIRDENKLEGESERVEA